MARSPISVALVGIVPNPPLPPHLGIARAFPLLGPHVFPFWLTALSFLGTPFLFPPVPHSHSRLVHFPSRVCAFPCTRIFLPPMCRLPPSGYARAFPAPNTRFFTLFLLPFRARTFSFLGLCFFLFGRASREPAVDLPGAHPPRSIIYPVPGVKYTRF